MPSPTIEEMHDVLNTSVVMQQLVAMAIKGRIFTVCDSTGAPGYYTVTSAPVDYVSMSIGSPGHPGVLVPMTNVKEPWDPHKEVERIKEVLAEQPPITADAPASSLTWEQIAEERRAKTAKYRNLVMRLIRETFPYVLYEEASAFFDSTDHYESMSTKAAETRLELLGSALAGPVLIRLHDHIEDSIRALKLQEEKAETNHSWRPPADKPLVGVKPETAEEREKRLDARQHRSGRLREPSRCHWQRRPLCSLP